MHTFHRTLAHLPHSPTPFPQEYRIELSEFVGGKWQPFVADDMQLEFVMLDPYVRVPLVRAKQTKESAAVYEASFRVPDVYGVFSFRVSYARVGYTAIELLTQVPVRPYRHDEYERFLPVAYPYYAATLLVMGSFFFFSVFFLFGRDPAVAAAGAAKKEH